MILRLLERAARILGTGSAFVLFFAGGVLLSYVLLPLLRLRAGTRAERSRRSRALLARSWVFFHDYMRTLRLIDYDPRETRLELPAGPAVLVANHPTLIDVTAIVSACPDVVSVAKGAMYRSPLVGRLLRHCDHVDAGDGSVFGGAAVVEQAVARLAEGTSVLIFPEGTRSPEHGLGPFQIGAVQIAQAARVPLIPVLVTCEPPTLMRGQGWWEVPVRTAVLRVRPLAPFPVPAGRRPRELADALRRVYLAELEAARGGFEAEDPAELRMAAGS